MTEPQPPPKTLVTTVSRALIERKVEAFIKDPAKNIKFVPDKIEKKFYTEMITMALECLDEVLNNVTIKVFDHEIKLDLVQAPTPVPVIEATVPEPPAKKKP